MAEPTVTYRAVHSSGDGNLPINRIVIHATCGERGYPKESAAGVALATAHYFQSSSAGGSAHYVVDVAGEIHCLPDRTVAWHAPPNTHSIGIEICSDGSEPYKGFKSYTRDQWMSPQVKPALERAAVRTRELCARFKIPLKKLTATQLRAGQRGICGHADVSKAFGKTDHTDPGPAFPWDVFMTLVQNAKTTPSPAPAGKTPAWPGRYLKLTSPYMSGADVKAWQKQMTARGWTISADGVFGAQSGGVCRSFQEEKGLTVDGVVGPDTWAAAFTTPIT